jgi:hypothetical protein
MRPEEMDSIRASVTRPHGRMVKIGSLLPRAFCPNWLLNKSKFAGRSKMVRCKEVKKSRTRSVFEQISGLAFFADAADCHFGAAC